MEHSLSSPIIGAVEADKEDFEIGVTGNIDAKDLTGNSAIEALSHAVGLGRIRPRHAVADLEL